MTSKTDKISGLIHESLTHSFQVGYCKGILYGVLDQLESGRARDQIINSLKSALKDIEDMQRSTGNDGSLDSLFSYGLVDDL